MAAISGSLTDNEVSGNFTPTETISEFIITRNIWKGEIYLQSRDPVGATWGNISKVKGNASVSTPDPAVLYRFKSIGAGADFDYYMGP